MEKRIIQKTFQLSPSESVDVKAYFVQERPPLFIKGFKVERECPIQVYHNANLSKDYEDATGFTIWNNRTMLVEDSSVFYNITTNFSFEYKNGKMHGRYDDDDISYCLILGNEDLKNVYVQARFFSLINRNIKSKTNIIKIDKGNYLRALRPTIIQANQKLLQVLFFKSYLDNFNLDDYIMCSSYYNRYGGDVYWMNNYALSDEEITLKPHTKKEIELGIDLSAVSIIKNTAFILCPVDPSPEKNWIVNYQILADNKEDRQTYVKAEIFNFSDNEIKIPPNKPFAKIILLNIYNNDIYEYIDNDDGNSVTSAQSDSSGNDDELIESDNPFPKKKHEQHEKSFRSWVRGTEYYNYKSDKTHPSLCYTEVPHFIAEKPSYELLPQIQFEGSINNWLFPPDLDLKQTPSLSLYTNLDISIF